LHVSSLRAAAPAGIAVLDGCWMLSAESRLRCKGSLYWKKRVCVQKWPRMYPGDKPQGQHKDTD